MKFEIALSSFACSLIAALGTYTAHACSQATAAQAIGNYASQNGLLGGGSGTVAVSYPNWGSGYVEFFKNNGFSVWFPCNTGNTFGVKGAINFDYTQNWSTNSPLEQFIGFPVSNELRDSNNNAVSHFMGGDIYYVFSTAIGGQIGGWIQAKWSQDLGGFNGLLGYPTSNESSCSQCFFSGGRINDMQNGFMVFDPNLTPFDPQHTVFPILDVFGGWPIGQVTTSAGESDGLSDFVTVSASGFAAGELVNVFVNTFEGPSFRETLQASPSGSVFYEERLDFALAAAGGILTIELRNAAANNFKLAGVEVE